jgi:peptidyl-tRNA hydrolase
MDKLYLIVRADLSPAQQAVQAAHALQEFNLRHGDVARRWASESNTLALLSVPDERELETFYRRAWVTGVSIAPFHEPDLGFAMTALAIGPAGKRLTRGLPLALTLT